MPRALLISVRFHDGRFHGRPEWPPSPARLFQALVAAAANGVTLADEDKAALKWLERLDPPVIAAPAARTTTGYSNYVPNNDLDAKGGDVRRIAEIRTPKIIKGMLFNPGLPILYLWRFDDGEDHAERVGAIADRLYQFGRGVDMAWAEAEILPDEVAAARLNALGDVTYCPCHSGDGTRLACPAEGTLASLVDRYEKWCRRFAPLTAPAPTNKDPSRTKVIGQSFSQPPKARFRQVAYDSPPHRLLFELRGREGDFSAWPFTGVVRLVETVRDGAARKFADALPEKRAVIDRVFIGRNATEADKAQRIRLLPLPSIGHVHADRAIRRLLVQVPPDCPLDARDIAWAFTAWLPHDPATGELSGWQLVEINADAGERFASMPSHYGIGGERFRIWRTVTPAALPQHASRRRINPSGIREEAKGGLERQAEERQAAAAVCQALRHAGIETPVAAIRVQREPFEARGARAEAFAAGTRFSKHRLWHVEISFARPIPGPVVIGDGRYLGLGIMAPVKDGWRDVLVFSLPPKPVVPISDAGLLVDAVRRALMALSRDDRDEVSPLFSGHEADGGAARSGRHEHVFLLADDADDDGRIDRLIVAAPWACDRSSKPRSSRSREFERVVCSLRRLRAGRLGIFDFPWARALDEHDALVDPARTWSSRTDYHPTRHAGRRKDLAAAVQQDLVDECLRRGFPRPSVEVNSLTAGPKGGSIAVQARLHFAVAVKGPVFLGRDSHRGSGVFAAER
jgi:CRISPR-associated protein Csb2